MTRQDDLETRLSRLVPMPQEELADEITAATVHSVRNTPVVQNPPRSYRLPLLTGVLGALLGAAAMFLVMTLLQTPTPRPGGREIVREIVVEVPISVEDQTVRTSHDNESVDETEISPVKTAARPPVAAPGFTDLDRAIDEAMKRQTRLTAMRSVPVSFQAPRIPERFDPSAVTPAMRREMLRQVLDAF